MASHHQLPPFIALRSMSSGGHAAYVDEATSQSQRGDILCRVLEAFSPLVKIEVETASTDNRYVHLRFCYSNKYWARRGVQTILVATVDQPEEDASQMGSTLFEPVVFSPGQVYIRHVQSGRYVYTDTAVWAHGLILMEGNPPNLPSNFLFRLVDWDSLVIMPKYVAFKGFNDMYLRSRLYLRSEYLQFTSNESNEEETAHEISMHVDGNLIIKSRYFDKFWRRDSSNWIMPDSTQAGGNNNNTLFWPVRFNDDTIALRSVGNDRFCTSEGRNHYLSATATTIIREARLQVVELVIEREMLHVQYRMEDARVFNERPFLAGTGTAFNRTEHPSQITIAISYESASSFTFSNSISIAVGIQLNVTVGLPRIAGGSIELSTEVVNSFEWNRTETQTKTIEGSYQVVVPPMSGATINYVATRGSCNVPFSYTQRDKLKRDGSFVTQRLVDGVYVGVNNYNFHFENLQVYSL